MNKHPRKSFSERAQMVLHRVEDTILVGLLLTMIGMAVTQIFLRNLFEAGIVWSDVLVRILVLWVGLVGAMVASRQGNHITIDILDRYLPAHAKKVADFVVELFTALICTVVAITAWCSCRWSSLTAEWRLRRYLTGYAKPSYPLPLR